MQGQFLYLHATTPRGAWRTSPHGFSCPLCDRGTACELSGFPSFMSKRARLCLQVQVSTMPVLTDGPQVVLLKLRMCAKVLNLAAWNPNVCQHMCEKSGSLCGPSFSECDAGTTAHGRSTRRSGVESLCFFLLSLWGVCVLCFAWSEWEREFECVCEFVFVVVSLFVFVVLEIAAEGPQTVAPCHRKQWKTTVFKTTLM